MNKPIEDWMLTAYVFGDLDDDQLQAVEKAIARDPALQTEVDEIRSTVLAVGKALHDKEPYLVSEDQLSAMRTSIASAMQQERSAVLVVSPTQSERHSHSRAWWVGLSALAASGLIALVFGPGLVSPRDDISFMTETSHKLSDGELAKDERGAQTDGLGLKYEQAERQPRDRSKDFDNQNLDSIEVNSQLKESEELKSNEFYARDFKDKALVSNGQVSAESLSKKSALADQSRSDLQLGESAKAESFSLDASAGSERKLEVQYDAPTKSSNGPDVDALSFQGRTLSSTTADGTLSTSPPAASPQRMAGARGFSGGGQSGAGAGYDGGGPLGPGTSFGANYGGGASYGGAVGGGGGVPYGGAAGSGPSVASEPQQQQLNLYSEQSPTDPSGAVKGLDDSNFRYQLTPALKQQVASADYGRVESMGDVAVNADHYGASLGRESRTIPSGPDALASGDRFEAIQENDFQLVEQKPVTTFSVDVDTASYSKIRQVITESNSLPNPNAVRVEEMINYFNYAYHGPTDNQPFAAYFAASECPWNSNYKLVRIALQAKKVENKERPLSNIVFLLDVSGSMNEPNKLPLVKKAIQMLVRQLGENDRVAIVVYAGAAGCVLPSTSAVNQDKIMSSLDQLSAGGSTNGGQGIELAYQIARENFIKGGVNRIILCTDGDFNVGTTSDEALVELVVQNAKAQNVFMTCLGFGHGNMNDAMMEKITNRGNGFYAMVDGELEARKIMVEQINATLMTVAKDVKIQVEFNPQKISAYRQIGYEDRKLENRDFNDDNKDAGEIGAGHRVTVLYEIVPAGTALPQTQPQEEPLRYSVAKADNLEEPVQEKRFSKITQLDSAVSSELLTVKLRYKKPEENVSTKIEFPLTDEAYTKLVDQDFRWASSIAQFGMLLRHSKYATNLKWSAVQDQAAAAAGNDESRLEAVDLIRKAKILSGFGDQK